ncbi:solute carrier family 6 (neurotransmitter transporter, betaine/GABA) member 12 [Sarotherodon galilaeus]
MAKLSSAQTEPVTTAEKETARCSSVTCRNADLNKKSDQQYSVGAAEPVKAPEAAMLDLFVRVLVLAHLHLSPHSTLLPT